MSTAVTPTCCPKPTIMPVVSIANLVMPRRPSVISRRRKPL